MLSISPVKSSAAAVIYFEKDDYYAKEKGAAADSAGPDEGASGDGGRAGQGEWFGKGADRLGLSGAVDPEQFKAVLEGRLPNGIELGRKKGDTLEHRPGWDLTFSAPKSVSVIAEIGGDERVIQAHQAAVKEALAYLQGESSFYRQNGFLNEFERKGDNLTVALFRHDTSRNQDPNLHTHAVTANAILRADGKWVSLYETPLYEHKMAAGNVYRAGLALRLQGLGYEVERTHLDGRFEIAGVPQEVIEAFSTRRQDIEESMRERGLEGAVAADKTAVLTRRAKTDLSREALQAGWIEQSRELGFDAATFVERAQERGPLEQQGDSRLDRVLREAIGRLSETEAVFARAELVRWGLAGAMGTVDLAGLQPAIEQARRARALYDTKLQHRDAWTTPQARSQEMRILAALEHGKGASTMPLRPEEAHRRIDEIERRKGTSLTEGQRSAVELIATSKDRFVGVLGRPGTGKTTMLDVTRQVLETAGYTVRGMAANSEAARQIQLDAAIHSTTIDKHLHAIGADLVAWNRGDASRRRKIEAQYAKQVWVIDEASQVDSGKMRRVVLNAERLGARLVMMGDTQQLAAINAGKPFGLMLANGMRSVEMDEIRRQRNPEQKLAVLDVVRGDAEKAMERLAGTTTQISSKKARLRTIVETWAAATQEGRTPIVLTATNADRTFLNDRMRDVRRERGELVGESAQRQLFRVFGQRADRMEAESYQPGDIVRFGRGAARLGIGRGEYFQVDAADRRTNTVTLTRLETPERRDRPRGQEIDKAPVTWNPRSIAGGAKFGVELYRPRTTTLATGERIVWNRNSADLGLTNGYVLTVERNEGKQLVLRKEDGSTVTIDTTKASQGHWEHDYAKTIYKSQGKTSDEVLVNAEAEARQLFNQKAFLVAISRQRDSIQLFTDDTKAFTQNVKYQLGDKTSALESEHEARMRSIASFMERMSESFRDMDQHRRTKDRAVSRVPDRQQAGEGRSPDPMG